MGNSTFYKRPWLYTAGWLAILISGYGWQIYRPGGNQTNIGAILVDLACIFPFLTLLWMAFFAQFVLPVRTFRERQKIFDRLITYFLRRHGPAMFIRDGKLIKREGEDRKKGPGVLWLDSASAAVTRTAVAIKQTMGPGVHFIDKNEYIAGTVDLHNQSQSLGPKEQDKPFEGEPKEDHLRAEWDQIQDRRKEVSALTRDGIEVVPNISVTFRVDTGVPDEGEPGSRFGFRISTRRDDKLNEEKDKAAIRKAILGEGINPNAETESPRHRIAWNQLPAILAVDLWREYVAKFTLDELFEAKQLVPPPAPQPPQITAGEGHPYRQPAPANPQKETPQEALASMLGYINRQMEALLKWLERKPDDKTRTEQHSQPSSSPSAGAEAEPENKTALQVINEMVKARLTQPQVDTINSHGTRTSGGTKSHEFCLLQERGLKVLRVSINNIRFNDSIERQLISDWKASWLANAKAEEERINRRLSYAEIKSKEDAELNYTKLLARHILKHKPANAKATLQALLMQTRLLIIRDDQLRRIMSTEREDIEDILQWMEDGP